MKRKFRLNTPEEEAAIQAGIEADPDNPEWTEAEFAEARPASVVVPELVAHAHAVRRRGAGVKAPKVQVTLRLDQDVLDGLRASGRGWQVRANQALRQLLQL